MKYLKRLQKRQEVFSVQKEGSITMFLALTMVLVLALLFTLLESARISGLQELAKRKLKIELESLFGAYNQELWNHYQLLFLDISYGCGVPDIKLAEKNIMEEANTEAEERHFYQMALKDIEIEEYAMATDQEGKVFIQQACETAKSQLAKDGVEYLKSQITKGQKLFEKRGKMEEKWNEAIEAEEQAEEYEEKKEGEMEKVETSQNLLPENPMEYVEQLKTSSLLALVLEEPSEISAKGIDTTQCLGNRSLYCGNKEAEKGSNVDKLWFIQYLDKYFYSKTEKGNQSHALDYELEYCISGKKTDAENLEEVVKKLLLLREAGNFITIMKDSQKKSLAMEIAVAAVGFTGMAPLIKAVQIGILLGWCYVESILDLRCLLSGGKVPFIKEVSQWKSDLFHIQENISVKNKTTEENEGIKYGEYLQILLCLTKQEHLVYRSMDIIEKNIRLISGNEKLCMDAMGAELKVNAVYESCPLFLNIVPIQKKWKGNYHFFAVQEIAY